MSAEIQVRAVAELAALVEPCKARHGVLREASLRRGKFKGMVGEERGNELACCFGLAQGRGAGKSHTVAVARVCRCDVM